MNTANPTSRPHVSRRRFGRIAARLALVGLAALPAVAAEPEGKGAPPAGAGAAPQADGKGKRQPGAGQGGGGGGGGQPDLHPGIFPNVQNVDQLSPLERREAMEFARQNMPNLTQMLDETEPGMGPGFGPGAVRRQRTWMLALARFHQKRYSNGKRDFPELEQSYLDDAKLNDEAVGLLRDLAGAAEPDRDDIRAKVIEKMRLVTQSVIAEQRRRVNRAREEIEKLEKALNRDERRADDLAKLNVERMEKLLVATSRNGPQSRPSTRFAAPGGK